MGEARRKREAGYKNPVPSRSGAVLRVGAFFQNDKPEGIGVEFLHEAARIVVDCMPAVIADYRANVGQNYKRFYDQLLAFAKRKHILGFPEKMTVLANIAYLEEAGSLIPDEYNGVIILRGNR